MIPFTKYEGCGNDFILIDNRDPILPAFPSHFLSLLCHRQKGIGADGVLLLENSNHANYRMRIFNSDGSEAEMCGNGLRCLAHYIHELNRPQSEFVIETMLQKIRVWVDEQGIEIEILPPQWAEETLLLTLGTETFPLHCLDTGVPHAVFFAQENSPSFDSYAPQIRAHPHFYPRGTNVNFATVSDSFLALRTFERGVERETLACGTGAVAAALAAARLGLLSSPIQVLPRSGDPLIVSFGRIRNAFVDIRLRGPANKVFSGTWIDHSRSHF
jgi:diaminopimelate epimerase